MTTWRKRLVAVAVLAVCGIPTNSSAGPVADTTRTVWILGGQSNMVLGLQYYKEELLAAFDENGLAAPTLVSYAVGGTSMFGCWVPDSSCRDSFFATMERAGYENIRGVIWYQGESDVGMANYGERFKEATEAFIAEIRDSTGYPELPFIQAQLAARSITLWESSAHRWSYQREMQRRMAVDDPYVYTVPTYDGERADDVHLTEAAYRTIGRRFAKVVLHYCYDRPQVLWPKLGEVRFSGGAHTDVLVRLTRCTGALNLDTLAAGVVVIDHDSIYQGAYRGHTSRWEDLAHWFVPIQSMMLVDDSTMRITAGRTLSDSDYVGFAVGCEPITGGVVDESGEPMLACFMVPIAEAAVEIGRARISAAPSTQRICREGLVVGGIGGLGNGAATIVTSLSGRLLRVDATRRPAALAELAPGLYHVRLRGR